MYSYSPTTGYTWRHRPNHTMPQMAMLFDYTPAGLVMVGHGSVAYVTAQYQLLLNAYRSLGIEHQLRLVSGLLPVEEVNHALECTGYVPSFLRDVG